MALTRADLDEIFRYQETEAGQLEKYVAVREAAKLFASVILANTPASADQTVAVRKVREAVMTANAAIALKGKYWELYTLLAK